MIAGINESKTLTKHMPCKCKCRFDEKKCNSDQSWNKDKRLCECKKRYVSEKDYVCNLSTCNCENGKYLAIVMCDEVIESFDKEANFNEKKAICKMQNFYIFIITITLLIAVSIYCYLIKYLAIQRSWFSFHFTNNKLNI